jgi:uncharacterized protein
MTKLLQNWHLLLGGLMVLGVAIFALSGSLMAKDDDAAENTNYVTIETKEGGKVVFNVELATTGSQQATGLMNRTELPEDSGMLFIFGSAAQRSFWMKDTLIPLDMLFLDEDGTINHIHHMAKPLDKTHVGSDRPSKAVLEINGGVAGKYGIAEGDKVQHPAFRNVLAP